MPKVPPSTPLRPTELNEANGITSGSSSPGVPTHEGTQGEHRLLPAVAGSALSSADRAANTASLLAARVGAINDTTRTADPYVAVDRCLKAYGKNQREVDLTGLRIMADFLSDHDIDERFCDLLRARCDLISSRLGVPSLGTLLDRVLALKKQLFGKHGEYPRWMSVSEGNNLLGISEARVNLRLLELEPSFDSEAVSGRLQTLGPLVLIGSAAEARACRDRIMVLLEGATKLSFSSEDLAEVVLTEQSAQSIKHLTTTRLLSRDTLDRATCELQTLRIADPELWSLFNRPMPTPQATALASPMLTTLQELDLRGAQACVSLLRHPNSVPNLTRLALPRNLAVSSETLTDILRHHPQLKDLHANVSAPGCAEVLAKYGRKLERLQLIGYNDNTADILFPAGKPFTTNLKALRFECKSDAPASDRATAQTLRALSGSNIEALHLAHCKHGDETTRALSSGFEWFGILTWAIEPERNFELSMARDRLSKRHV